VPAGEDGGQAALDGLSLAQQGAFDVGDDCGGDRMKARC
jgi:hypothetical protein